MADKKITQKYWDSLSEDSRYRALRRVFSDLSDKTNHDWAKLTAKQLGRWWKIVQCHVKIPAEHSHYKTCIDHTYIP